LSDPSLVFLFGLPRSGTKLARDLLNRHPDIAIFPHESHFIPYFARTFQSFGSVSRKSNFLRFYAQFRETTFARRMQARGIEFDRSSWYEALQGATYRDVLRAMFGLYSQMTGCRIVGDKTPGYVSQVSLLATLFPEARYIHIVRDPRDYACSIREAWGKSIPRAAQRWKQQIRKYHEDVSGLSLNSVELSYEWLLAEPRQALDQLCRFLGVNFRGEMLVLDKPAENLARTRHSLTIVSDNSGKWRSSLTDREVATIERICGCLMSELGYAAVCTAGDEDLNPAAMTWQKLQDGLNLLRFRLRQDGGLLPALAEMRRVNRFRDVEE
jgi:Sulfotransferase family